MKCFYHTDMDGKCAGAIVKEYYNNSESEKSGETYIPINYKDDFPFDSIVQNETIVIVDFSLQKEGDFERLIQLTDKIIWIDHHKTAIEKNAHLEGKVSGVRKDGVAGCVLTWNFFFPEREVPRIVKMLGDYDIWDFSNYGNDLNVLQTGIRLYENHPESCEWRRWLEFGNKEYSLENFSEIMNKGLIALQYRDKTWAGLIKSWSFWATFEGYKVICCNAGSVSSQLFNSVKEDFDLMMPFVFDGKQWTVSIYSTKDIDCSELAKKYGGGGHKKAAGFQCKELPFHEKRTD